MKVIKHIVMWDVCGDSDADKRQTASKVKNLFEGLAGNMPGLNKLEVGIDVSGVD